MQPILIALALLAAPPQDDARTVAVQALDRGARLFDARDAKGLAETYAEDAEFALVAREADGTYKADGRRGRAEMEEFYRKLFENPRASTAKNTVEYAKRVGPDLLLIAGTFTPDIAQGQGLDFVQVRVKAGDRWLIRSLRVFVVPRD